MLRTRVVTALVLLGAFVVVLFVLPKPWPAAAFGLIAGLAAWEWAGLVRANQTVAVVYVGLVLAAVAAAYVHASLAFPFLWSASAIFWLGALAWLRWRWPLAANPVIAYLVGVVVIVPTWAAMVALHERGPWWLFAAMALVWIADIAAYFTGRALGRRKLAPTISPGKTWEGVWGACGGVLVYGYVAALLLGIRLEGNPLWIPLLLALTAFSIVGDLFESLAKRQAGVKDSGRLLPGHGGVLDRIDSQTSTLPLVALIMHWSFG